MLKVTHWARHRQSLHLLSQPRCTFCTQEWLLSHWKYTTWQVSCFLDLFFSERQLLSSKACVHPESRHVITTGRPKKTCLKCFWQKSVYEIQKSVQNLWILLYYFFLDTLIVLLLLPPISVHDPVYLGQDFAMGPASTRQSHQIREPRKTGEIGEGSKYSQTCHLSCFHPINQWFLYLWVLFPTLGQQEPFCQSQLRPAGYPLCLHMCDWTIEVTSAKTLPLVCRTLQRVLASLLTDLRLEAWRLPSIALLRTWPVASHSTWEQLSCWQPGTGASLGVWGGHPHPSPTTQQGACMAVGWVTQPLTAPHWKHSFAATHWAPDRVWSQLPWQDLAVRKPRYCPCMLEAFSSLHLSLHPPLNSFCSLRLI